MKRLLFAASFAAAASLSAQTPADSTKPAPIEDNSFLVEEAYNQEAGVVQHISALSIDRTSKAYEYDFTQEWPVGGITHQLSYTIPIVHSSDPSVTGLGDVLINYRYQLVGDGEAKLAVAPRFTLAFPTGAWKKGEGNGAVGYEGMLPASLVLSDLLVTHFNAGLRVTPNARDVLGDRAGITRYTLGGSAILLAAPTFNLMLETIWTRGEDVIGPSKTLASDTWTISPGARFAFNFKSGLQIVPGIAFPIGVGPSRGDHGVYLYLSFEHPFSDAGRKK